MPTLIHFATPQDAYAATSGFSNVTGYTDTFTPAGSGSIILLMAIVPWDITTSDANGRLRFARGGVALGPEVQQVYEDAADEGGYSMLAWAVTGLTGSQTFTVQADEVQASLDVETAVRGMFVIIEFASDEANLYEGSAVTSAQDAPGTYATCTSMTKTYTPAAAGSIHLMMGAIPMDGNNNDSSAFLQFAVDDTALGYMGMQQGMDNSAEEGFGGVHMTAVTGQTGSTEFSLMWQDGGNGDGVCTIDTGTTRQFQSLEILGSTLHYNADGTSAVTSPGTTFTAMTGMSSGAKTITAGSVVLMVMSAGADTSTVGSDTSLQYQFTRGASPVEEGPVAGLCWADSSSDGGEFTSATMAWASTASGSQTYGVEWREMPSGTSVDTGSGVMAPRLQIIECKVGAAPAAVETHGGLHHIGEGMGDPGVAVMPQTLHTIEQGIAA